MNRNQKIAIGCGAAGCLGLILIMIVVVVLYVAIPRMSNSNRDYNFNSNGNSNSNSNTNTDSNSNSNTNSDSDSSNSSSSMTDDGRHKLFQAAAATQDHALTRRVWEKLGLLKADGSPNDDYEVFMKEHIGWIFRNASFVQSISNPEKARAYVDEHIDD
jgi:hypothetical protein